VALPKVLGDFPLRALRVGWWGGSWAARGLNRTGADLGWGGGDTNSSCQLRYVPWCDGSGPEPPAPFPAWLPASYYLCRRTRCCARCADYQEQTGWRRYVVAPGCGSGGGISVTSQVFTPACSSVNSYSRGRAAVARHTTPQRLRAGLNHWSCEPALPHPTLAVRCWSRVCIALCLAGRQTFTIRNQR
jgi:hypothetical protein